MSQEEGRRSAEGNRENWFEISRFWSHPELPSDDSPAQEAAAPSKAFDSFVEVDKTSAAYMAHSYPTKVPPEAIEQFIQHYSERGQTILDPFCGSGMTGLAARRSGRNAILSDLSPLAVHLAYNHATKCNPENLKRRWQEISASLESEIRRLYGISCDNCHGQATIRYTIWSDVYKCPTCGRNLNFWQEAVDQKQGTVSSDLECSACGEEWRRSADTRIAVEPTWVAYKCSCSRALHKRALEEVEREQARDFDPNTTGCWYPSRPVEPEREMYKRSALHLRGIETVADFYTPRNLSALALLWAAIGDVQEERIRAALTFAFTNTSWHGTKMRRFNARGGHRPLTGTLYIPQLSSEANIFDVFENKILQLERFYRALNTQTAPETSLAVRKSSATELGWLPDNSIDYVFTDPPFGSNIFYADCNLIAESWLGDCTNTEAEAVINRSLDADEGGKTLGDYKALLTASFSELYRVLKPDRWATVVFQNSDGEVWSAIQKAASTAGFSFANANGIDKGQKSMKGYKGRSGAENVASFDIILNLRKERSAGSRTREVLATNELKKFVAMAVQDHLTETDDDADRQRTLPYLYSLVVRRLLNEHQSVAGFSMAELRSILEDRLCETEGCWYLPAEDSSLSAVSATQ